MSRIIEARYLYARYGGRIATMLLIAAIAAVFVGAYIPLSKPALISGRIDALWLHPSEKSGIVLLAKINVGDKTSVILSVPNDCRVHDHVTVLRAPLFFGYQNRLAPRGCVAS